MSRHHLAQEIVIVSVLGSLTSSLHTFSVRSVDIKRRRYMDRLNVGLARSERLGLAGTRAPWDREKST